MASDKQLERIKKLEEEIKRKQAALLQAQSRIKEKERKARTRRLIEVGGLAEIAGIINLDSGTLLGGFITLAETIKDEAKRARMKAEGDSRLAQREVEKKTSLRKQAAA
jgi:N-acetylglutamate synthase/N-acetylornithine aminotransferase